MAERTSYYRLKHCLIYCVILFFASKHFGQNHFTTSITTSVGLPNNNVRSLYIDSRNVLWIGTENGVARYVNGEMQNFSEMDGLANNSCWHITEDFQKNMWFTSYGGGVSMYDGKKFKVFNTRNGLKADKCRKVYPFGKFIFIATEVGISVYDPKTKRFLPVETPNEIGEFIAMDFFQLQGQLFVVSCTKEEVFKIKEQHEKFVIEKFLPTKRTFAPFCYPPYLYLSHEGSISEYLIDDFLTNKKLLRESKTSIFAQFMNSKDVLFAAADGLYRPDGGLYCLENKIWKNVSNRFQITSDKIVTLAYDKLNDVLYAGSLGKGVFKIQMNSFATWHQSDVPFLDIKHNQFKRYLLHKNGLTILDAKKGTKIEITRNLFKKYQQNHLSKEALRLQKDFRNSKNYEIDLNLTADEIQFYEIEKSHSGIWIPSNIGIFELDFDGKFKFYTPKHSMQIDFTTNDKLIETNPYGGVKIYDNVYKDHFKFYSEKDSLTPQFIVATQKSPNKTYLASVFNGLFSFQKGKFRSYLFDKTWKEKRFKHLTWMDSGKLVASAEFGDVYIIDDSEKFRIEKKLDRKQLHGKTITFLTAYQDILIIATEKGINFYQKGIFKFLDSEQGIPPYLITGGEVINNTLWVTTEKGYYEVSLDFLKHKNSEVKEVYISNIIINNKSINENHFKWFSFQEKKLDLDYNQNTLNIDYVPIGHLYPEKLRYRYRLNAKDKWSPYDENPSLFLPYLPSGKYILEVAIHDANNGKEQIFKLLDFKIKTPFWKEWWFWSIIFLCILFIFVGFILWRMKINETLWQMKKEKLSTEKRLAETRLHAMLGQMNPHFIYNAMNAIQGYIFIKNPIEASNYVSELAKLMRLILNNSSNQLIPFSQEIDLLKLYIKFELRRMEDIKVNWIIPQDLNTNEILIPSMIIQPFIENVFVHAFTNQSEKKELSLKISELENLILFEISDNGQGNRSFEKAKKHESKAITLIKERLSLLQPLIKEPVSIQFTSKGTIVLIKLIKQS